MRISVAMCTYNGEKYIRDQIMSIQNQTCKVDEVIICDDCSTDNTVYLINELKNIVTFDLKLFENGENVGSTINFNNCINKCRGDVILLCDQDDIWHSNKVFVIIETFEKFPDIGLIFSNANILIESSGFKYKSSSLWDMFKCNSKIIKKIISSDSYKVFIRKNYATGATVAFKNKYIGMICPIPNEWVHDHYIAFIISMVSKVYPLDKRLITYRIHNQQQLGNKIGYKFLIKNKNYTFNKEVLRISSFKKFYLNSSISLNQKDYIYQFEKFFNTRVKIRKKLFINRIFFCILNISNYTKYSFTFKNFLSDIFNI